MMARRRSAAKPSDRLWSQSHRAREMVRTDSSFRERHRWGTRAADKCVGASWRNLAGIMRKVKSRDGWCAPNFSQTCFRLANNTKLDVVWRSLRTYARWFSQMNQIRFDPWSIIQMTWSGSAINWRKNLH